jgi:ribonucleoside-triphosphate reductase
MYNLLNNVSRKYAKEHKDGYLHIHDLNMYNLTFNCLFAPVGKLLASGFDSGTGFQRPARSIQSATALTAVILQLQSNQQYGGIACDNFDFDLAPFVDISFRKNLAVELNRYANYSGDEKMAEWAGDFDKVKKQLEDKLASISMNQPEGYLCDMFPCICVKAAISKTDDDTHQAMEALVHNLNSLQSRSGNQVPFSSLNFGLDTSNCGRMVSQNIMRAQYEGMGDGLTPIFPILIFKLMKGYTKNEGDPNYDLYLQAIDCLARRFYPNFVSVDSTFNKPYVQYETQTIEFVDGTELVFKKRGINETATMDMVEPTEYTVWEYEVVSGEYWEVTDYKEGKLHLRKLIPNTTIATMGCRTRVIGNINGPQQTTGRGNFAFHTINLPRLAIESHISESDIEKRKTLFFDKLDGMLDDAKESLLERFRLICNKTYEKFPFTMQEGLYLTSDDEKHKVTDTIAEVMKQSTLSIGYVGLAETVKVLTGKTYGIDHEVDEFAVSIIKHMREFTDAVQKETHFNWSTFATPAEAVAGRFANIDKNRFATEVTDEEGKKTLVAKDKRLADVDLYRLFGKGYYTNSHMMDFSLETTLENKIAAEAPFHKLTNAGHIFYFKVNGDPSKNPAAVKKCIDAMYDGDLGYFTVSYNQDTCLKCGFHGIIDNVCPKCGCANEDLFARLRRVTGYLVGAPKKSYKKALCDGKLAEMPDRVNI